MLIRCGECGREISDAAPSCPHCGILRQLGAAPAGTAAVSRQPFFLIAAAICLFLSLFTPRIVVVLPVLVTVLFGIISIVRRETWRPAAALCVLAAIGLFVLSSTEMAAIVPQSSSS